MAGRSGLDPTSPGIFRTVRSSPGTGLCASDAARRLRFVGYLPFRFSSLPGRCHLPGKEKEPESATRTSALSLALAHVALALFDVDFVFGFAGAAVSDSPRGCGVTRDPHNLSISLACGTDKESIPYS